MSRADDIEARSVLADRCPARAAEQVEQTAPRHSARPCARDCVPSVSRLALALASVYAASVAAFADSRLMASSGRTRSQREHGLSVRGSAIVSGIGPNKDLIPVSGWSRRRHAPPRCRFRVNAVARRVAHWACRGVEIARDLSRRHRATNTRRAGRPSGTTSRQRIGPDSRCLRRSSECSRGSRRSRPYRRPSWRHRSRLTSDCRGHHPRHSTVPCRGSRRISRLASRRRPASPPTRSGPGRRPLPCRRLNCHRCT
jgi:hypothetical protein